MKKLLLLSFIFIFAISCKNKENPQPVKQSVKEPVSEPVKEPIKGPLSLIGYTFQGVSESGKYGPDLHTLIFKTANEVEYWYSFPIPDHKRDTSKATLNYDIINPSDYNPVIHITGKNVDWSLIYTPKSDGKVARIGLGYYFYRGPKE